MPKTNILLMDEDPAPGGISKILVNTGINYLSTVAGFLPSTISLENGWDPLEEAIYFPFEMCFFFEGVSYVCFTKRNVYAFPLSPIQ